MGLNEEDSQGESFLGLFETFPTMPLPTPIALPAHGVVWLLFFCILGVTWSFNKPQGGTRDFVVPGTKPGGTFSGLGTFLVGLEKVLGLMNQTGP